MRPQTKYHAQILRERSLAAYLPYSSHLTPNTLITREGDLCRIWKIGGISFETLDPEDILIRKEQFNGLLKSIATNQISLWTHGVRRKFQDRLLSKWDNAFCEQLDKKYYDSFQDYPMMSNDLYLTVIYRPHSSWIGKRFSSIRRTQEDIRREHKRALKKLNEIGSQIEQGLSHYDAEVLTTYTDDKGILLSEPLQFLNYLISSEWHPVRVPSIPLYDYLGTSQIFIGTETLEIRSPTHSRYAQCLDFKDYPGKTQPGMLNALMYEPYEFVMTQSFSFLEKQKGQKFLERQQNQLMSASDVAESQIAEMSLAMDQLANNQFAMGEYHFTLMVFADSLEDLREHVASAKKTLQNAGFMVSLVSTATDAAFYAQLPGNWSYRPRLATLTSRNFVGLSSFHNFSAGKRDRNPWGPALVLAKTPSGQPLYLNFHAHKQIDQDHTDDKLLANARIIGYSGSGKTVLLSFLLAQAQKFKSSSPSGFSTVFFDKDRGAELIIRALGGKYFAFKNRVPTGLNPFQLPNPQEDPRQGNENIDFLKRLVQKLVSRPGENLSTSDEMQIHRAVDIVMRMQRSIRCLSLVSQNMIEGHDKDNSIVKRLQKWCRGQPLGWALDNPQDQIDLTTNSNYGFDGTHFLDHPDIKTPLSMYLLHRMESLIDGRRFIYFMDEAWKWVEDEAFSEFVNNKQLTIRKQNGLGVFATQMPSSLLESKNGKALVQQTATEIYLPNPKADADEYMKGFKLTESEFQIVLNLNEAQRTFLVKQGHNSSIGRIDLKGLDEELLILSGSTDNIEILDALIEQVGEDPEILLPAFIQKVKERKMAMKKS